MRILLINEKARHFLAVASAFASDWRKAAGQAALAVFRVRCLKPKRGR
jgi:hypothetical protein